MKHFFVLLFLLSASWGFDGRNNWKHLQIIFFFLYRYTKGELDIAYITTRIIGKHILVSLMDLGAITVWAVCIDVRWHTGSHQTIMNMGNICESLFILFCPWLFFDLMSNQSLHRLAHHCLFILLYHRYICGYISLQHCGYNMNKLYWQFSDFWTKIFMKNRNSTKVNGSNDLEAIE